MIETKRKLLWWCTDFTVCLLDLPVTVPTSLWCAFGCIFANATNTRMPCCLEDPPWIGSGTTTTTPDMVCRRTGASLSCLWVRYFLNINKYISLLYHREFAFLCSRRLSSRESYSTVRYSIYGRPKAFHTVHPKDHDIHKKDEKTSGKAALVLG